MAIAREFECKDWTAAQYDELISKMGMDPGRTGPGVLFHWATVTPEGIKAVDVYESREAADRIAEDRIGPVATELGLSMPDITEHEVHSYLTP